LPSGAARMSPGCEGWAFGAGVVDGHVQATEARDGPIDQIAHGVFMAHAPLKQNATRLQKEVAARRRSSVHAAPPVPAGARQPADA
jgi:hypothetical protein